MSESQHEERIALLTGHMQRLRRHGTQGTKRDSFTCQHVGFESDPQPPADLWDTDDASFLDKVRCRATVRVIMIDPKASRFEVRMRCKWRFRTLNTMERTEIRLRTPGIRMPGLLVSVDESRIWRDHVRSSSKTIFWRGISMFTFAGFEIFEMKDFPFDRQVINLELFEFVWRPDKDSATHDFSMNLVEFRVETDSMLPEWGTYPALIHVQNVQKCEDHKQGPSHASRFTVQLRVERRSWYYVIQIFLVTYLITTVSCFPLAMPPTEDHIGDRLSLYGGGLLTLVAFKYGVADHLPCVPYSTYTDWFLLMQVCTLIVLCVETLIGYRLVLDDEGGYMEKTHIDIIENVMLAILCILWLAYFLYAAFVKRPQTWEYILQNQEAIREVDDDDED